MTDGAERDRGWILCVDDDEMLLSGLELQLGLDEDVVTATGGEEGLRLLADRPGCSVIISDMRMPQMNGAEFLAKARVASPDSTRLLLTGYSDTDSAISAINDGRIFRFLTKPTSPEDLKRAVDDAVRQWELVRSERILLEQTVRGAAESLVEALEIASPAAFSRARRLEDGCRHVATRLGLDPVWPVALAGLFLRLGWIAIPSELVEARMANGRPDEASARMFEEATATSVRLVQRIPRLEEVAAIIAATEEPSGTIDAATILAAVSDFDDLRVRGHTAADALGRLAGRRPDPILRALASWPAGDDEREIRQVWLRELIDGMTAEEDITGSGGQLLVRSGTELTGTLIDRLRNYAASRGVTEPIAVSPRPPQV
jgi:CheY-like chemotaxis protein